MSIFNFKNIKVSGISCAVPNNVKSTESYKEIYGVEEVEKFMKMTGVLETRRTSEFQTASDLGFRATRELLNHKEIDPNEIGALIFGTTSPDYRRPGSASILHYRLGLSIDAAVFDINLGCSSLIYGMQVVSALMQNSNITKAILVVGDTASKTTNPGDRASVMLVGEAAVSVLLEKEESESITSILRSDGSGYRYLIVPGGGYRNMNASREVGVCSDGNKRSLHDSFMQGTSVFTFTISDVPRIIRDYMDLTGTLVEDYHCFAFHQANLMILKQIAKKLKIPADKMPISLPKFGNTSGASPFVTLCDSYGNSNNEEIKVLICAFGVGLSWGVSALTLRTDDILPIFIDDEIFYEGLFNSVNDLL